MEHVGSSFLALPNASRLALSLTLRIVSQPAVDTSRCGWRVWPMSDSPARIVYALPPGKRPAPRGDTNTNRLATAPVETLRVTISSSEAIAAFLELLRVWDLAPARGWRMLTGLCYRTGPLTADQITRVQHLLAINAGMQTIRGDTVGEWMVAGNGAAVLSGSSPVDVLTRAGTPAFAALERQVGIWVRM